jgi:hypothetical protein
VECEPEKLSELVLDDSDQDLKKVVVPFALTLLSVNVDVMLFTSFLPLILPEQFAVVPEKLMPRLIVLTFAQSILASGGFSLIAILSVVKAETEIAPKETNTANIVKMVIALFILFTSSRSEFCLSDILAF